MYIAHYTTIEVALGHIIPNQKLRFSSLQSTNDSYEARYEWHLGRQAFGHSREEVNAIQDYNENERNEIKNKVRIACFSYGNGIKSCGNNTALWTYYASGKNGIETGCAILFNENMLLEKITESPDVDLLWNGKIKYMSRSAINRIPRRHINPTCAFDRKLSHWKAEREYRIIVKSKQPISGPYDLDISTCVAGIVLNGMVINEISKDYVDAIPAICKGDVRFVRRYYNSSKFKHQLAILGD